MAFRAAADAKTASDAAAKGINPAIGSLTEALVNVAIDAASTKTGALECLYLASINLDADLNGGISPVYILQSDRSTILLDDLTIALNNAGYRISVNKTKTRNGTDDRVNIQIAWD